MGLSVVESRVAIALLLAPCNAAAATAAVTADAAEVCVSAMRGEEGYPVCGLAKGGTKTLFGQPRRFDICSLGMVAATGEEREGGIGKFYVTISAGGWCRMEQQ